MPDVFVGYGGTLARADDKIIYRSDIPADIAGQIIKESLGIPEVVWIHVINESWHYQMTRIRHDPLSIFGFFYDANGKKLW